MARKQQQSAANPSQLRARVDRSMREGKFQTALDLAKQLNREEPTPEHHRRLVECYLGRANQLIEQGSTRDASTVLDVGHAHSGADPELTVRFAEAWARCGDVKRALGQLEPLPEPKPANQVLPLAADVAVQRGAAGRDLLPESMRPDFDRVRTAFVHLLAGQDDAVRETIQGIGLSSPFLEWKVLLRGLLAFYQNDDARAVENWSRLNPTRLPARLAAPYRSLIDRPFVSAQTPATQQLLRAQAERLHGDSVLGGIRKIQAALVKAQGWLNNAFREVEGLLPILKQQRPELVVRLARCFYWEIIDQGRPEDTARYQRLFGRPPEDPEFARMAAMALETASAYDAAHQEWQRYEKSLGQLNMLSDAEKSRARAMVWFRMGTNARKQEDVVRAVGHLPLFPFGSPADKPRALKPAAEQCFLRAAELAPDWLEPGVGLVGSLHLGGKRPEAIAAAESLLNRFPDHLPTLELLARLHRESGDVEKAADALERALRANPLNRALRRELGQSRRRLGARLAAESRFDEARDAFRSSIELLEGESPELAEAAWAASEFKAGETERGEELLRQAATRTSDPVLLDGWLHAHAVALKLPKLIKARFERAFKDRLDAASPAPEQAVALVDLFALLEAEQFTYHGGKTHQKKALTQLERTLGQPYPEAIVERLGKSLILLKASRLLRRLAEKWAKAFPTNPWPPFFEMESYLMGNEERWPLWRLNPLAQRAKELTEKLPTGPTRDYLLKELERRQQQFRDLNPFAAMFDEIADRFGEPDGDSWEDDEPW